MRPTLASLLVSGYLGQPLLSARRHWQDGVAHLRRSPLTLFYQVGDPYSHLCARVLHTVLPALHVEVEVLLVPSPPPDTYPEAEAQRAYALLDCQRIAPAYDLNFEHAGQPDEVHCHRLAACLQAADSLEAFLTLERECVPGLFAGQPPGLGSRPAVSDAELEQQLRRNDQRRRKLGHYLSGMWHFRGEWFWALDRLPWLEERLQLAGVVKDGSLFPPLRPERVELEPQPGSVDCYYSFRSPYSYLVVDPLLRLHHSGVNIRLKPVLPMVMRGLPVPRAKRLYIVSDAKRVAVRQGTPFGRVADPLGPGVEFCLKVFPLCQGVEQQLRFCQSVGRAAWAEGLDLAVEKNFRYAVERAGLDWTRVGEALRSPQEPSYAEDNRRELQALGLWGVPSFRVGEMACWGQDRLWLVTQCLE